jgi:hypothetical protein
MAQGLHNTRLSVVRAINIMFQRLMNFADVVIICVGHGDMHVFVTLPCFSPVKVKSGRCFIMSAAERSQHPK